MFHFYIKRFEITCVRCKKEGIRATSNNQKYCIDCRKIVEKEQLKASNKARYKITEKECSHCHKIVKEQGMRKRCKECIQLFKDKHICKRCKTNLIPNRKRYCEPCLSKMRSERAAKKYALNKEIRVCKYCNASLKGHTAGKEFCNEKHKEKYILSQEPQIEITKKEKEKIIINPFFLKPRGSKSKKKIK